MKVNLLLFVIALVILIWSGFMIANDRDRGVTPPKTATVDRPPGIVGPIGTEPE
jgi:hypothetical protein